MNPLGCDEEFYSSNIAVIAGIDEVGRGALAGPVVAACCVMPREVWIPGINDSKKVPKRTRERIATVFKESKDCYFALGIVEPDIIDEINILQANLLAMQRSFQTLEQSLQFKIDLVLIDGLIQPELNCPAICQPKFDERAKLVAMASILAKVHRDELMMKIDELYPEYGFARHKGYGTAQHRDALRYHGPCPCHRKSFAPVRCAPVNNVHGNK